MTDWKDDRAKQDSLIKRPERAEPETRLDRAASDEFADDRDDLDEPDAGEQSNLTTEAVGDGNQMNLSGETAGDDPDWRESA